jgi:hypothetical protein
MDISEVFYAVDVLAKEFRSADGMIGLDVPDTRDVGPRSDAASSRRGCCARRRKRSFFRLVSRSESSSPRQARMLRGTGQAGQASVSELTRSLHIGSPGHRPPPPGWAASPSRSPNP